jgi:hypothetical protein
MTLLSRSSPTLVAAALLAIFLAGCGAARPAATPSTFVTEADSGRMLHLSMGQAAALRLSHRYAWSEPRADGNAVRIVRSAGVRSTAYDEWTISAVGLGTATITSSGRPACTPGSICPAVILGFSLTVVVT